MDLEGLGLIVKELWENLKLNLKPLTCRVKTMRRLGRQQNGAKWRWVGVRSGGKRWEGRCVLQISAHTAMPFLWSSFCFICGLRGVGAGGGAADAGSKG